MSLAFVLKLSPLPCRPIAEVWGEQQWIFSVMNKSYHAALSRHYWSHLLFETPHPKTSLHAMVRRAFGKSQPVVKLSCTRSTGLAIISWWKSESSNGINSRKKKKKKTVSMVLQFSLYTRKIINLSVYTVILLLVRLLYMHGQNAIYTMTWAYFTLNGSWVLFVSICCQAENDRPAFSINEQTGCDC